MFQRRPCFLLVLANFVAHASGQAVLGQGQTPAARATTYQIDTLASRVYIKVSAATRLGHSHGVQGQLRTGTLTLDGAGELVFEMKTFIADTPDAQRYVGLDQSYSASDASKVNANMRGAEVLDVAHFPTATCTLTGVRPLDGQKAGQPGRYQFAGQFMLHGVSRPLEFTGSVEPTDQPGRLRVRGSFTILQTSHGIQPYSTLAGLIRVADELQIWGDLFITPVSR